MNAAPDTATAAVLLKIYDSANLLFGDDRRGGSADSFARMIAEDEIIFAREGAEAVGFLSYNKATTGFAVITGLYVSREFQGRGIAGCLISRLVNSEETAVILAEILNNAPWAKSFYEKHGFIASEDFPLADGVKKLIGHNPWSRIYVRGQR